MLEYFYDALTSPRGIFLECEDRYALRQKLYAERRASDDVQLSAISLVFSPLNPRQLWLVKRHEPDAEG